MDLTKDHLDALGEPELEGYLGPYAFCALNDGKPIAAGGISEYYWHRRGIAWFTKGCDGGKWDWRWWPPITRAVKKAVELALESGLFRRIEMTIYDNNDEAKRWAVHLGFKPEAFCRKLMDDGSDGWIYAIVRDD